MSIVDVTRAKNAPLIANIKKFLSWGALPVNDADARFLVDPDLRSHSEERPDPKTNPEPKREVVRARACGAASCGRDGVDRHQVSSRELVSSSKIKRTTTAAKKKTGRTVARDRARGAGTGGRAALLVDHL